MTAPPTAAAQRKVSVPAVVVAVVLLLVSAGAAVATPVACAPSMLVMGVAGLFGGSGSVMGLTLGSGCALVLPGILTGAGFLLVLLRRPAGGIALALLALLTCGALLAVNSFYFDEHSPLHARPHYDTSAIDRDCGNGMPECPAGYTCYGTVVRMQCHIQCSVENECPEGTHCSWDAEQHRNCRR